MITINTITPNTLQNAILTSFETALTRDFVTYNFRHIQVRTFYLINRHVYFYFFCKLGQL